MGKYKTRAVGMKYCRPRIDFSDRLIKIMKDKLADGDFVIISEKAIAVASGNILDESSVKPSFAASIIARFWMRIIWGYILGALCHFRSTLIQRLRAYPYEVGSRHKHVALHYAGFLQALMFGSEGGIDGSNIAYSYVSLPLKNANAVAERIREKVWSSLRKKVFLVIVDTDKTYSFGNFHFTPRPKPINGIHSFGGFVTYVIGRSFKLKRRATPIAVAGCHISAEKALEIAELANRARGFGAGRTVWDMAAKFKVGLTEVSWEMLETVKHKPIVIVRSKR